ncbi:LysE/ArgO family amino acid transporter [Vibrio sp. S4M6]|uniref:LysE/ArgO family amino acid transporter n=1 Tax=Vibrio sinus TaxID=2946865 RepID=UPI00202A8E02|nr:LysE/ArgO family amino acid transporter [Vibrio sinus]MCL9783995.1 LysE/ArgO family amino acid transporter [Vibrio sinus]
MNYWIFLQGFGLGASMIIPIGAQNAYVLSQGIKRNHHLATATICSLLDTVFISLGVFGGGVFLSQNESLLTAVTVGGIVFLFYYSYLSLRKVFEDAEDIAKQERNVKGRSAVVLGALAVTVLNPHVYLDTVVILGSIGGQFDHTDRVLFVLGTIMASFTWFYAISIGAAKFSPILSRPNVRKSIDLLVAIAMFVVASALLDTLWLQYLS